MKKTLAAATAMVAALFTAVGPAGAATGSQHFSILAGGDEAETVIATGAFFAVGEAVSIDEDNDLFSFPDGTFMVNHPETGESGSFNTTTCVGTSRFTGTYTLSHGTGAYAGISGSGTYSGKVVFQAGRTDDGGCSEDEQDGRLLLLVVNTTGTATLP